MTETNVQLELPAAPEYLRLARVVVANVAGGLGFTLDEIDDLRMAVDEVCSLLSEGSGPGDVLAVTCLPSEDLFTVVVRGPAQGPGAGDADGRGTAELAELILAAVVDEFDFEHASSGSSCRLVKKRRVIAE